MANEVIAADYDPTQKRVDVTEPDGDLNMYPRVEDMWWNQHKEPEVNNHQGPSFMVPSYGSRDVAIDDELIFEGELHDSPEPALPSTDGEIDEPDNLDSPVWNNNHDTNAPNPASAGPADFGAPLDPNNYHEDMGIKEIDDDSIGSWGY